MPDNETEFVLLESLDGYSFVVPRAVACASGMLKSMLDEESKLPLFPHSDGRLTYQARSPSPAREHARSNNGKLCLFASQVAADTAQRRYTTQSPGIPSV